MSIATIEADIREAAVKIEVEADHLAHAIRQGLKELLGVAEKDKVAAQQLVAEAQPAEDVPVVESAPVETSSEEPAK